MTNTKRKKFRAEIIAIGDELTTGQRVDTNSQWLSQRLTDLGFEVVRHTTIGDDLPINVEAFRSAAKLADVVITTGGLGPTADDLTRDALAEAAGVSLESDAHSIERIEAMFRRSGREMPENNRRQADFPVGAASIDNNGGTAPGIAMKLRSGGTSARFFCLPGVPVEMKQMWEESVFPRLESLSLESGITRHYLVRCFGVGESRLEEMLPNITSRGHYPRVGITATKGTLTLRLFADGETEEECYEEMKPTLQTIREKLGKLIFAEGPGQEGEVDLHEVVLKSLGELHKTLVVQEAMTEGLIGNWMIQASDNASAIVGGFAGGEIAKSFPDDEQSLKLAAERHRIDKAADFAILIGSSRPENESTVVPVVVTSESGQHLKQITLVGHPEIHKPIVAKHALKLLRDEYL